MKELEEYCTLFEANYTENLATVLYNMRGGAQSQVHRLQECVTNTSGSAVLAT